MNSAVGSDVDLPSGFHARPIDPDADVEAVTDLVASASVAEYGTPDVTQQMVRKSYKSPAFDPRTDGRLVVDSAGQAAGVVEYYDSDIAHVAPFVYVRVRPDLLETGIGEALVAWAESRGRRGLGLAAADLRVSIRANAAGVNESMQRIFERSGWSLQRVFWTMEIELGEDAPAVPPLPAGIRIRTAIAGQEERAIQAALDEAFADHFGYLPLTHDDWMSMLTKMFPFDPSLWFLAVDGDQIAGLCLCILDTPGRPEWGWVNELGVRPAWRGRGLGLALLKHAFADSIDVASAKSRSGSIRRA